MNPNQIRKRQVYIKATPLKDRIESGAKPRREENFVQAEKEVNSEFDTFFDYEDDLAGMKASNEQVNLVSDMPDSDSMVMVSEHDFSGEAYATPNDEPSPMVMKRASDSQPTAQHGELGSIIHGETITPIIMRPEFKRDGPKDPSDIGPEKLDDTPKADGIDVKKDGRRYDDVVGFEFVRCEYIMKNEKRCRRQAPKNSTICSIHKKMLNK